MSSQREVGTNSSSVGRQKVKGQIQPVHLNRYPFSQCNYEATTKSNLQAHLKSVHEGIMYSCNQCDLQKRGNILKIT